MKVLKVFQTTYIHWFMWKATSGTSFEVLRDFALVCSENGRLKMAEKSNWQKPPLKTKYKSCRKDLLGKRVQEPVHYFRCGVISQALLVFCVSPTRVSQFSASKFNGLYLSHSEAD